LFGRVLQNLGHHHNATSEHIIKRYEIYLYVYILNTLFSLPTLVVDKDYKDKLISNKDEATKKCVVCMDNFELNEVLKTLPCCKKITLSYIVHIFHSNCIDEWMKSNSQCPICKCDLD